MPLTSGVLDYSEPPCVSRMACFISVCPFATDCRELHTICPHSGGRFAASKVVFRQVYCGLFLVDWLWAYPKYQKMLATCALFPSGMPPVIAILSPKLKATWENSDISTHNFRHCDRLFKRLSKTTRACATITVLACSRRWPIRRFGCGTGVQRNWKWLQCIHFSSQLTI